MRQLEVRLLGRFEVLVDSRPIPADAWAQRRAADLVKLLALAPGHRMPRDEVLEMLWPQLGADSAAANLHKAASHARSALGDRGAVVLRGGVVELAPAAEVTTDVERFERGDDSAYGGELLPDERYEQWTLGTRARLRERQLALLRSEGRWDDVLREDPADEEAHRALMRQHVASGDRPAARGSSACCATSSRGSARALRGDARARARAHAWPGGAGGPAPARPRRRA